MKPGGRLLIVEMVLPAGDTPHPGKMLDMMMLVGARRPGADGGRVRGAAREGGLRLTRVVPTASAVSVVEAVPA